MRRTRRWASIRAGVILATRTSLEVDAIVPPHTLNRVARRAYRTAMLRDIKHWRERGKTVFLGRIWLLTSHEHEILVREMMGKR